MDRHDMIENTEFFVRNILQNDSSGHDWWHIFRVRNMAVELARKEDAKLLIVELAALLHDVADEKLNSDEQAGINKVIQWLKKLNLNENDSNHIIEIIKTMSFKGGHGEPMTTLEGKIVQDADRLDAIGAVGIARTFAYAGSRLDLIYDPSIPVRRSLTKAEYRNGTSTAINHFYEKLLKLSELMNTKSAKEIAMERHRFMEAYLDQFYKEWNGTK
ncbi:HD domain-containing protein [Cytobacillus sp. S13-E01]|uniref:HD domain-containing protein n=1 Tax=Cytobacillus sp. S13-E01 TaxID=3031326 RepID=UPI0023D82655|nr:HD domain-containing protein [Cytobacillus sp. S13-E01]MDF0725745.1 HD domain-containing protein [Cytobacillus sp. S13-E01]